MRCYLCNRLAGHEVGCPNQVETPDSVAAIVREAAESTAVDRSEDLEREAFWREERRRLGMEGPSGPPPVPVSRPWYNQPTVVVEKARDAWIGFDTVVRPGTLTITARPQSGAFRGEHLFIWSETAVWFALLDVRVGNRSMFIQYGAIPGEPFSAKLDERGELRCGGQPFSFETCQVAQDLVLMVENIGKTPHRFLASIRGKALP